MSVEQRPEIEALYGEGQRFEPDPSFAAQANAQPELYEEAERDFEEFWARIARERVSWSKPFDKTLEWDLPFAKWFVGGELNMSYNCVDRHVENGLGDKVAYHWIAEPGDTRTITYGDLHREVQKAANALKELGIEKGDRVAIYMPMIPELPIAMLACARLGAPHTVVFGGFSAEALSGRINDAEAKLVITADGSYRRGKAMPLKPAVDEALEDTSTIEHVLIVRRLGDAAATKMTAGRDVWWHDIVERQAADCPPVPVDSEHMLYLLYTSGTTAKPKGIMHTTAGYLVGTAFTHWAIFDVKPDDVYWCAADIGWVTGHSYIVYGPLANATTSILYEGSPDTPAWDRWWQIIEEYKVDILYCAPTAIRAFMKQGSEFPAKHDLGSLRVMGSVGEPINPEAWLWYHEHIGGGRTPIVDTWWQTETGQIMISPLPGITTTKPGSATFPFPGVEADVVDSNGKSVPPGGGGYLVLKRPWPAMLRGIYGDPERYKETYW
ncbi:MAG: acetate--CoA ligase, partial [Chloroflexota bacterium]